LDRLVGKRKPAFPKRNTEGIETVTFEVEGATTIGSNWEISTDDKASNGSYATFKAGIESISEAPAVNEGAIAIPFSVKPDGKYAVFARLNCPSADDDSFWVRMDGGAFESFNGLGTSGWSWVKFDNFTLKSGEHTLTIAYREDGAKLDKISISNDPYTPEGMGEPAKNAVASK
jgi:hypothetical protein